jgi:hypothetical protein
VKIVASEANPSARSSKFAIQATVGSGDRSVISFQWISQPTCDGNSFATIDTTDPSLVSITNGGSVLTFRRDPLALLSGASYCIEVLARNRSSVDPNAVGRASFMFSVRAEPDFGNCRIVGDTKGEALSYEFVFRCGEWTTDPSSGSIWYTFYRRNEDNTRIQLGSRTRNGIYKMISGKTGVFDIVVEVNDEADGRCRNPPVMTINVTETTKSATDFLSDSLNSFSSNGNVKQGLQSLVVGMDVLGQSKKTLKKRHLQKRDASQVQQGLLTFLKIVVDAVTIDYFDVGPLLSKQLRLLNEFDQNEEIASNVLTMINNVLQSMNRDAKSFRECFSRDVADDILITLDEIIDIVFGSNRNLINQYRNNMMNELVSCLQRQTICGASPMEVGSSKANLTLGSVDPAQSSAFGIFNIPSLGQSIKSSNGECVQFQYSVEENLLAYNGNGSIENTIYVLNLRNETVNLAGSDPSLSSLSDSIDTSSLVEPAVFEIPIKSNEVSRKLENSTFYKPVCVYFKRLAPDYINGTWDSAGCSVRNYTTTSATCACYHLTEFGIEAQLQTPPQGPNHSTGIGGTTVTSSETTSIAISTSTSQSNATNSNQTTSQKTTFASAAIVLIVAGCIAGIVGMGFVGRKAYIKRQKEANRVEATSEPNAEPSNTVKKEDSEIQVEEQPRDPAKLPPYQLPPSYEEHMAQPPVSKETRRPADLS